MLPLALWTLIFALTPQTLAVKVGGFEDGGHTRVSAMMMFLGNEEKVYIMDKVEGNAATVNGHVAWASVWDIATRTADTMDVPSNIFCSSGLHLPNGSFTAFGGNGAVGRGGNAGSQPGDGRSSWDNEYYNSDGTRSIRILKPCKTSENFASPECQWFDDVTKLSMKKARWYSTAEALADGTTVLIGGFANGGYVNRDYPNVNPNGGGSENTYEFFPARPEEPPILPFLTKTSGLNAYVHAFLMPSGRMFLQANYSSTLWNYNDNTEIDLPDMPGKIIRVYPASGAVAMLPLTPENDYTPTILFCGGSDMPDEAWGDFKYPLIDTWEYPASKDCQRITPEPSDGSQAAYVQDDDMLEGRTMSQFIILPDGKLLVVNGALNGTAGYAQRTGTTENYADMPYGESLAHGPVGRPAIYDPNAPAGQRWSNEGLDTSPIPRMYHSSAMLLPDGSVLIAGSNPNVDVNITAQVTYPTEYRAEVFFPPYFKSEMRPQPEGLPTTLSYGGPSFDISVPSWSYSGSSNDAADNTIIAVTRGGYTTHAMNMGQRFLQLNNTYTVQENGTIVFHVSQMPPIPEIFQPGPAWIYVTVNGIPSVGSYVIVGSGRVEPQARLTPAVLPAIVLATDDAKGTAKGAVSEGRQESKLGTGVVIKIIVGAIAVVAMIAVVVGVFIVRKKRATTKSAGEYSMSTSAYARGAPLNQTAVHVPLHNGSPGWNASTATLDKPYRDDGPVGPGYGGNGHHYKATY